MYIYLNIFLIYLYILYIYIYIYISYTPLSLPDQRRIFHSPPPVVTRSAPYISFTPPCRYQISAVYFIHPPCHYQISAIYFIHPLSFIDQYRPKIFISYGTDVENEVCRIASNLNKGYDCFLDAPNVSHDEIRKRLSDVSGTIRLALCYHDKVSLNVGM